MLLAGEQLHWARRSVYSLLAAVRPDAVALVDAFGYDDYLLNSALGRKDGDVYRCCPPACIPSCHACRAAAPCAAVPFCTVQLTWIETSSAFEARSAMAYAKTTHLRLMRATAIRRALLEMAQESPLNDTEEGPAWRDVLAPRMAPQAKL